MSARIDYDLRPCPYCSGMIGCYDRNGKRLQKKRYDARAACFDCRSFALADGKKWRNAPLILEQPIDVFIYGGVINA